MLRDGNVFLKMYGMLQQNFFECEYEILRGSSVSRYKKKSDLLYALSGAGDEIKAVN